MIQIELKGLPFHIWNEIFKWVFETLKVENCGITWDYDPKHYTLHLSEKSATIFLLKWSYYGKA